MRSSQLTRLCLLVGVVCLSACGTSKPTKYYVLSSDAKPQAQGATQRELTIGVGPIRLPRYLDRQEVVSRTSRNELDVSIFHQWAEPLARNFSRVIEENMAAMIPTDRIIVLPVRRSVRKALLIDYQVTIAVSRFEKGADGVVLLNARWVILDNDTKELLLRRSVYRQKPAAADYAAQAAAQSELLSQLSKEIAGAILELERERSS